MEEYPPNGAYISVYTSEIDESVPDKAILAKVKYLSNSDSVTVDHSYYNNNAVQDEDSLIVMDRSPNSSDTGYMVGSHWYSVADNELYMQVSTDPQDPNWYLVGSGSSGGSDGSLTFNRHQYTGDGETKTFSVRFDDNYVDVFVNGVKKTQDVDYTLDDDKTYIEFNSAPADGTKIFVIGWQNNIDPNLTIDGGTF